MIINYHHYYLIGAGAGGSSAAYWISEAFANSSVKVNTTVYEQSPRIGGRAEIMKYKRDGVDVLIELGASLFVDVNYYVAENSEKFGLEFIKAGEGMKTGM